MSDVHRNFIAGEWVGGASARPNINPSNVGDVIGEYAQADAGETRAAIAAAKGAAPGWAAGGEPTDLPASAEISIGFGFHSCRA